MLLACSLYLLVPSVLDPLATPEGIYLTSQLHHQSYPNESTDLLSRKTGNRSWAVLIHLLYTNNNHDNAERLWVSIGITLINVEIGTAIVQTESDTCTGYM